MVGRSQIGRMDRRLRQAHPHNSDEILGGMPAIFFGDFAQLPPVGDSPMYSDKPSGYCTALHAEGHHGFESFKQSVTLNPIFRQAGQEPEQVVFREALLGALDYERTLPIQQTLNSSPNASGMSCLQRKRLNLIMSSTFCQHGFLF